MRGVFAAVVLAVLLDRTGASRRSFLSSPVEQLGVRLPDEAQLDFSVVRPAPLVVIASNTDVRERGAERGGAVRAVVSADSQAKDGEVALTLSLVAAGDSGSNTIDGSSSKVPVAWASYNDSVAENGWAYLSVGATADPQVSDDLKMYAAGFLEGFVSARQIRDFHHNANVALGEEEEKHHALANVKTLMDGGLHTLRNHSGMVAGARLSAANAPVDPWWRQARYALLQTWGILDGYNLQADTVSGKAMSLLDLMILSSDGETPELEMAYDMEEFLLRQSEREDGSGDNSSKLDADVFLQRSASRPKGRLARRLRRASEMRGLNDARWRHIKESSGRCSALVRLADGGKDLFVGHTTFSDYSEMTRIFKYYDFPLGENVAQRMGFSSYPGVAGSTDDYYLMDSGLVVTETTISMLTDEPYDKLGDNLTALPDFMRIMLANRLARTGKEWADLMQKTATGTYSSQWIIVDYNRFAPGKPLDAGALWILEQVPGLSHQEDMTEHLQKQGFWSSENRAWFKSVRDSVGATEAEDIHGNLFSANKNPRANIFAATAPHVTTLADMREEMQRNKWPHEVDGGEGNTPDHAIAARGDLDAAHPNPNGGVDAKVTNACLARRLQCNAISGPTHDSQKPFRWVDSAGKDLYPGVPHDGLPDVWNFDWVRMTPVGQFAVGGGTTDVCDDM